MHKTIDKIFFQSWQNSNKIITQDTQRAREKSLRSWNPKWDQAKVMATLIPDWKCLLLTGRKVNINIAQTSFNVQVPQNDRNYFNYKVSMHQLHSLKKPNCNVIFFFMKFSFWYSNPEKVSYFHFDCKFSSAEGYLIGACGGFRVYSKKVKVLDESQSQHLWVQWKMLYIWYGFFLLRG